MDRIFLHLILAQHHPKDAPTITLRDLDGNEQILDGLHHTEPHGEAWIEMEAHNGIIKFPGWLTSTHPHNAFPIGATAPDCDKNGTIVGKKSVKVQRIPPASPHMQRDEKSIAVPLEKQPAE